MTTLITTAFRSLATLRRARAFHPRGVLLRGEVESVSAEWLPLRPGPVLARLSKGAGTPGAAPDALGLALRFGAPSSQWDLLLTTSMPGRRVGRMLPWPSRTWASDRYSSLMPYRAGDRTLWFGAEVTGLPENRASTDDLVRSLRQRPLRLKLQAAAAGEQWQPIAEITLSHTENGNSATPFDPITEQPPGLRLAPEWLASIREAAYSGSRKGRPS